ncbi:tetratricopeptide repeat protein [Streptomyces sp. NBC_00191]|uniref:tetratricopeptide repeat protein n=1 Tax=Streptomyces sp. NBC_00191 TaxID=2975674 RepID=UPI00324EFB21
MADEGAPNRIEQHAFASGHARVTQIGRDQYNFLAPGSGPAPQALAALPAAPPHLVGRDEQTQALLDLLDPQQQGAATVVTGPAGIGKTALALHTAHRAADHGWFPGGVLFVPLRGYDPAGPVTAEQALGALLRALGLRNDDLPPTLEERAGLYQSELARRADEDGAVLLVADDASGAAQVMPLVPARCEHRLLVTSRHTLASLPARLIALGELAPGPAADLISGTVTRARPDDPRPATAPSALAEVAAYCGHLPLALHIAAALLTADPGLPVTTLATDLADARTRLEVLRYDDGDGRSVAVRAAFDLSYRRLESAPARLFRLFALNPGPDLATEAAAALISSPVRQARHGLAALARAGLVGEQPIGGGRWRMHDLIRLYAADLAHTEESRPDRDEATDRLLEHYRATAEAANVQLQFLPGQLWTDRFPDRAAALAWLDTERPNLIAAVAVAAGTGRHPTAISLTIWLATFLSERRHYDDAVAVGECALTSAQALGDRHDEASALTHLGAALGHLGRLEQAADDLTRAVAIFRECDDRHGAARSLGNLGSVLRKLGRSEEAVDAHSEAVAAFRELGDRDDEAIALNSLGLALTEAGRLQEAIDAHTQAVAAFRDTTAQHAAGGALGSLGTALQEAGRFEEAIDAHLEAAAVYRDYADPQGEAEALGGLGRALQEQGQLEQAIDAFSRAAVLFGATADREMEGTAWTDLGIALAGVDRLDEAFAAHTKALAIARELSDRLSEGKSLTNLGLDLNRAGRRKEAVVALAQGAALLHEFADPSEGMALNNLGLALNAMKRYEEAVDALGRSVTRCRESADRSGEGMALYNFATALRGLGRYEEAVDALKESVAVFHELADWYRKDIALDGLAATAKAQRSGRIRKAWRQLRGSGRSRQ